MSSLPEVVAGVVVSGPTAEGMSSGMAYVADVNNGGTLQTGVPVSRPVIPQWDSLVIPIPAGSAILGVKVGGIIQWQYRELPALGPCSDGGGTTPVTPAGSVASGSDGRITPVGGDQPAFRTGPSLMMRLLLTATPAELSALKTALEQV